MTGVPVSAVVAAKLHRRSTNPRRLSDMNKFLSAALLLTALAAGSWWLWSQRDGYDYEAAFEHLPEADPSAD